MAIAESHTPGIGIDESTRSRDVRAAEQPMGIWPVAGGLWKVGTGSDDYSEYVVDLLEGRCSCDDWTHRGEPGSGEIARCKHASRILQAFEVIETPIEADVDEGLVAQCERWAGHQVSGGWS